MGGRRSRRTDSLPVPVVQWRPSVPVDLQLKRHSSECAGSRLTFSQPAFFRMRRQEGQLARKVAIEQEPSGGVEMMDDVPCGPGCYLPDAVAFHSLGLP